MSDERCQHGHSTPTQVLDRLHDSQAGTGRHKCTNCAYARGYEMGLAGAELSKSDLEECQNGSFAPRTVLAELPGSQGGSGRHKCTICAFVYGYEAGKAIAKSPATGVPKKTQPPLIIGELQQCPPPPFKNNLPIAKSNFRGRRGVDYRSIAEENETLGKAGEALVAKREMEELRKNGRPDLALLVEIIPETQGDGLGYDVLSYDLTGKKKFIEVKTTTGPAETPFFLTATELAFSKENSKCFHLVRVYGYKRESGSAEFYAVAGDIEKAFNLVPVEYRVTRN